MEPVFMGYMVEDRAHPFLLADHLICIGQCQEF